MSTEVPKPIEPAKTSEAMTSARKDHANISRSVRRFELFFGVNLNARRPDQGGVWDEHDIAELKRQERPVEMDPSEGKLICTITFKPEEGKVIYDYPDGARIER